MIFCERAEIHRFKLRRDDLLRQTLRADCTQNSNSTRELFLLSRCRCSRLVKAQGGRSSRSQDTRAKEKTAANPNRTMRRFFLGDARDWVWRANLPPTELRFLESLFLCPTLQISHASRAGEPSLLKYRAMLSVGVIIDEGEIKGVGLWLTGSASF